MKKLIFSAMTVGLLGIMSPSTALASKAHNPEGVTAEKKMEKKVDKAMEPQEIQALVNRVEEIKAMNFSKMSMTEKKALKKELKGIKSQLKAVTGVYISAGALIIIIILLLLLL